MSFKIGQNKNGSKIKTVQQIKSRISEKEESKTLAKIQVTAVFFKDKICGEIFYPDLYRIIWRRHAGAHLGAHQHSGRKPTKTSVTELLQKSALSLKELKNIKIILFLIYELFRSPKSPAALSAVM